MIPRTKEEEEQERKAKAATSGHIDLIWNRNEVVIRNSTKAFCFVFINRGMVLGKKENSSTSQTTCTAKFHRDVWRWHFDTLTPWHWHFKFLWRISSIPLPWYRDPSPEIFLPDDVPPISACAHLYRHYPITLLTYDSLTTTYNAVRSSPWMAIDLQHRKSWCGRSDISI